MVGQIDATFLRVYAFEGFIRVPIGYECVFCPFIDEWIVVMLVGCVSQIFIFIGTLIRSCSGFFHSVTFFHAVFDGLYLIEVSARFLVYDDLFLVESRFHLKVDDEATGFT